MVCCSLLVVVLVVVTTVQSRQQYVLYVYIFMYSYLLGYRGLRLPRTYTYFLHRTQASPASRYRYYYCQLTTAVLIVYTFHYSNSNCLCSLCYTLYSTAASPACVYCCTCCAAVQWLVLLCEKKLLVRHVFLAASLRAPVRTAAVYIPVSTYAAVYPIDILRIVVGCCPVYAPAVLPKGAGVGTTFVLSC